MGSRARVVARVPHQLQQPRRLLQPARLQARQAQVSAWRPGESAVARIGMAPLVVSLATSATFRMNGTRSAFWSERPKRSEADLFSMAYNRRARNHKVSAPAFVKHVWRGASFLSIEPKVFNLLVVSHMILGLPDSFFAWSKAV